MSHDGSAVPLAPNAWRVENGRNSGDTGPEIASAMGIEIMHVITGVRDEQWYVEDDTAVVFYTIDVDLGRLPGARRPTHPRAPSASASASGCTRTRSPRSKRWCPPPTSEPRARSRASQARCHTRAHG